MSRLISAEAPPAPERAEIAENRNKFVDNIRVTGRSLPLGRLLFFVEASAASGVETSAASGRKEKTRRAASCHAEHRVFWGAWNV